MNKKIKGLVFLTLAFLGLLAAVVLVKKTFEVRKGAAYGKLTLSLLPKPLKVCQGGTKEIILKLNPVSSVSNEVFKVGAAELTFAFDKEKVEISSIDFHEKYKAGIWNEGTASQTGELKLTALSLSENTPESVFDLVKITVKGKAVSSSTFSLKTYKIKGTRGDDNPDLDRDLDVSQPENVSIDINIIDCTDLPELVFKIWPGGTRYLVGEEEVVVENIPDQKVKVVIKKDDFREEFEDVTVVFDENAVGFGIVSLFGVPEGEGYIVLIKGPVHLARKFCYDEQDEHCWLGEEDITFVKGVNEYDWSGLDLEPGDINGDGVVDSTDFSQLKQALGQSGEGLKEDLNFNGIVNPQDIVIFLKTLGTKYEEEV